MATITEIQLQDGSVHQLAGGGGETYTLSKIGDTITLTGSGGDTSSVTDSDTTYTFTLNDHSLVITPSSGQPQIIPLPNDDTTYTISKSGNTITLTGSDGSTSSVIVPDGDTTYTISVSGHTLTLTGSDGSTSTATLPDEDTTYTLSISGNTLTLTPSSGTAQTITLPIPSEKVFVATYGTTTFAELLDAYNAEKVIYLKRASNNFTYYYPVSVNPATSPISKFYLYFASGNRTISRATLTSGNSWSISSYTLQDELVSGTNIKTINGQSLLGSGDLPVAPPVTSTDVPTADTISEFDSTAHMNSTDMTTGSGSELEDFIDGLNVSGGGEYIKTVTFTGTMPIKSSGQYWDITFSTGTIPTGYIPIGIISVNTGTSNAGISGFYLNGSGIPFAYGKTSGNQSTTASAEAKVLCVKSA